MRRFWLLYDKHTSNWRGHYRDGRNQHSIATPPPPRLTHFMGTKTLWGNKCFIWLSRHHNRPSFRQRNLSIWHIPPHDNWEPSTNVTQGIHHGSNWFGTLEQTHSKRNVKCIPLHLYCIQSLLRINQDLAHRQHFEPRMQFVNHNNLSHQDHKE